MKKLVFTILITALLFGMFAILSYAGSSGIMSAAAVASLLCGLFAFVLPKVIERVHPKIWITSGVVILAVLFVSTVSRFASLMSGTAINFMLLIPLALVNAAFLLYAGLRFPASRTDSESQPHRFLSHRAMMAALFLGTLLVVAALFNLYESTVWDNTYDSLGYIWLFIPVFAILLSGLTLLTALPSKMKLIGLSYILLLPVLLVTVSSQAQKVDFRHETAQRAERVVKAIEAFYAGEGHYPESLSELSPRYVFTLLEPVVIYGQDWCYESGEGYYRLGYVDREHWSDPRLIGRIYKTAGQVPGQSLMCESEITTLQQNNPDYPYTYWMEVQ